METMQSANCLWIALKDKKKAIENPFSMDSFHAMGHMSNDDKLRKRSRNNLHQVERLVIKWFSWIEMKPMPNDSFDVNSKIDTCNFNWIQFYCHRSNSNAGNLFYWPDICWIVDRITQSNAISCEHFIGICMIVSNKLPCNNRSRDQQIW